MSRLGHKVAVKTVETVGSLAERVSLEISLASAIELCRLGLGTMVDIRQSFEIEMKGAIPDTVHIPLVEVKLLLGHALTEDEQDILDSSKTSDIDVQTFCATISQLHHARDNIKAGRVPAPLAARTSEVPAGIDYVSTHATALKVTRFSITNPTRRALMLGMAGATLAHLAGCGGGGGAGSGGMGMSGSTGSAPPPLTEPVLSSGAEQSLPLIPLDGGEVDVAGVRSFALSVQSGTTSFHEGVNTNTLGYNGALLGPALRLRKGEKTSIRVQNDLDEETTVHWHGLVVPAEMDGGPHQVIAPGAQWQASFTVNNPASTCWFHPHTHGSTGRQVVKGLAGLLIVEDPAQAGLELPSTWGVDDLPLVLQDKRFTASGQIDYALTASDRLNGYVGDVLLVNGAVAPVWQAPRQWIRLRLLNGCNARFLTLRMGNGTPLLQVANESGLLAATVARQSITLAPGERAEALVDFSNVAIGQDVSLLAATSSGGMGMGGGTGASEATAMKCRISLPRQPGAIEQPPGALASAPAILADAGATVRSFNLGGGMMSSQFTINGRVFDMGRVDLAVPANTVEIWKFTNATGMAHPIHVHGVRMSLLARDGALPPVYERGLRDTFVVQSMETVTVAVETAAVASATPLMFHCHILEHEDAGMMGQFITV